MITSTECETREACSNSSPLLQPILGTDKRNPIFSVCRQAGPPSSLHVYYGAELLEVVPEERQHPAFKLLVARLYNAGVKGVELQRRFRVDRKTMRRWGQALQSGDAEQLVRALAGRGGHRKLTPEIQSFVRVRFPEIYQQSRAGYSQRLRTEIQRVFGVRLSGECLRPLLKGLRAELRREVSELVAPTDNPNPPSPGVSGPEPPTLAAAEVRTEALSAAPALLIRKESPVLPVPVPGPAATGFCHHLGVLLFSVVLLGVEKEVTASGWLLKQWLATLLLGAVNIEQTKLLDFEDLRRLLGRILRSLFPQRSQLTELAAGTTATQLLSFNAQLTDAAQQRDFYFDPHTKHYTGMQHVLKGWCARIRWADKVLHSDFFHTAAGQPVYLECADNYQDMRERFAALLPRFRQTVGLPAEAAVTCIIDRGIFSHEVFATALEAPDYHLITWEKNFKPGPWDPQKCSGQYALERTRNHAQDKRVYRFEYLDQDWAKNPKMRQLIVQATNPQGITVQVGILTDDRQRVATEIIYLMFNRWTQENDFKYLDEHWGINQITSYASVAYERLKGQVEQKQIKSGEYKALAQKTAQLKSQLSKLLLSQHQHPRKSAKRTERIAALTQELNQAQQAQAKTQKEVSRLEVLIQQQTVRLDTRNKRLLDSLKLIARNAFYQALRPFKTAYNNYRDDHELFRNLTHADGVLVESADQVEGYLLPTVNYPPIIEKIVNELLAQFNAQNPKMPDGSGRRLRLRLGQKTGLQIAIVS
jgi:transposase-like protein